MSWLKYKIERDYCVGIFDNGEEMKFDEAVAPQHNAEKEGESNL